MGRIPESPIRAASCYLPRPVFLCGVTVPKGGFAWHPTPAKLFRDTPQPRMLFLVSLFANWAGLTRVLWFAGLPMIFCLIMFLRWAFGLGAVRPPVAPVALPPWLPAHSHAAWRGRELIGPLIWAAKSKKRISDHRTAKYKVFATTGDRARTFRAYRFLIGKAQLTCMWVQVALLLFAAAFVTLVVSYLWTFHPRDVGAPLYPLVPREPDGHVYWVARPLYEVLWYEVNMNDKILGALVAVIAVGLVARAVGTVTRLAGSNSDFDVVRIMDEDLIDADATIPAANRADIMHPAHTRQAAMAHIRVTPYRAGIRMTAPVDLWVNWSLVECGLTTLPVAWTTLAHVKSTALRDRLRTSISDSYEFMKGGSVDECDLAAFTAAAMVRALINPHFGLSPGLLGH